MEIIIFLLTIDTLILVFISAILLERGKKSPVTVETTPQFTDEQLKKIYEADQQQTEKFFQTLQSLNNFMTGNEPEEVKQQND